MSNELYFQTANVIYSYTDREAIEDGILVAINRQDRVTRAVWEYFVDNAPKDSKPPACWPVDMMGWFQAERINKTDALQMIAEFGKDEAQAKFARTIADRKALALSKGIISTHAKQAKRVYDENIEGGIYKLFVIADSSRLEMLCVREPSEVIGTQTRKTLWLMPNENGGATLMFPEDY